MAESNAEWGELAQYDDELARLWDTYEPLPEPGANPVLDSFVKRKNIDIPALLRLGARLSESTVIVYGFPGGIKYRDLVTDSRWAYAGSEFTHLKIVRHGPERTEQVIVAESETDAARLTMLYDVDVAIMPAGAKRWTQQFADDLDPYTHVLIGLDNDEAGEIGTHKIEESVPNTTRFGSPVADWADVGDDNVPPLPAPISQPPDDQRGRVVFGPDLRTLEVPDVASWFEHALLPIGGLLMLHGWKSSFKSWMALDMMRAIAENEPWALFEPTEEAAKVAVIQAEIPWPYLRERLDQMHILDHPNFGVHRPQFRPELHAGNVKQEDAMLADLVESGVQVALFDPIRRFMGAGTDPNLEKDARKLLAFFERLNMEGITVVFVHHDNKAGRNGPGDVANTTGSGAFPGDPDTVVSISLPPKHELNDPLRNLHFTIRNGPPVGDRSMELQSDGTIRYSNEPIFEKGVEGGDESANQPAI